MGSSDAAGRDQERRQEREGTIPPPTPRATLGASEHTSRKHQEEEGSGVGGGGAGLPPKGASGEHFPDSSDSSDHSSDEDDDHQRPKRMKTKIGRAHV